MIARLYRHIRSGVAKAPRTTLSEVPASLKVNPTYRDDLPALAGDDDAAAEFDKHQLALLSRCRSNGQFRIEWKKQPLALPEGGCRHPTIAAVQYNQFDSVSCFL